MPFFSTSGLKRSERCQCSVSAPSALAAPSRTTGSGVVAGRLLASAWAPSLENAFSSPIRASDCASRSSAGGVPRASVPQFRIARSELGSLPFVELAAEKTQVFPSKGECRKMVQGGGVSLNKEKVADPARTVGEADLIAGKYLLVQRGKKNYYLVIAE